MAEKQTAGRRDLGEFAPKFAELNDDVLFGEVWSREEQLSLRDRSLVTVVALMSQGLVDSSFGDGEKEWHYKGRNCGNSDPCGVLCRLAKGVGSFSYGKGGMERGKRWSRAWRDIWLGRSQ